MKHLALYRKWRPQRFEDLVGQKHISRTLLNAIRLDRLAHAYLFCGPRGTGKTSSARLLAKALNCEAPVNYEPCNACQNCEEITAGHSLDVIEIDAASNRGIDAARDLREQVRFSASAGKYRVFIIDEFHMLTKEAFNALLKTLEEPPEKVIFVLATTEPHAVLPTIVSRCQRFDFQRIGVSDMRTYLRKIADAEHIGISDAALDALSRKANGGLRDGMSLLDQVQAIGEPGEDLPDNLVYLTLGLVEENALIAVLESAFSAQPETLIQNTRLLLEQGHDALQVVQELIQLLRHLSLAHLPAETLETLSVPAHLITPLKTLAENVSRGDQVNALEQLLRTGDRLHHCSQPDIWLEADLLCLCLQSEPALLKRVETLEKQVKDGVRVAVKAAAPTASSPLPSTVIPSAARPERPSQPPHAVEPSPTTPARPQPANTSPPPAPTAAPPPAQPTPPAAPPQTPSPSNASIQSVQSSDPAVLWEAFIEAVKTHQKPVIGFLMNGHLEQIDAQTNTWILAFQGRFQRDRIQKKLSDRSLQTLATQIMGRPVEIEVTLVGEKKKAELKSAPTPATPLASEKPQPTELPESPLPPVITDSTPPPHQTVANAPARHIAREPLPEAGVGEDDLGMADMGYLPEDPVEADSTDTIVPIPQSVPDLLPKKPAPAATPLPSVASPSRGNQPAAPRSETRPVDSPGTPREDIEEAPIESLQEVADIFKGKIVTRRN